jgi:electron transfer flavoprotein-quinone oxidoreductase
MQDERVDVIVVGAGAAGAAAALELARAGLEVVVIERGAYPGSKNVMGGIIYRQPTEQVVPEFWNEAPLERAMIEQRFMMLTEEDSLGGTFRTQQFAREPHNAYTVMRGDWDQWFAGKAEEAGAFVIPEMVVSDFIWRDGKIDGVRTGDEEGDLLADVVIIADGANSLLAQKAGLHKEWSPKDQALISKELIRLSREQINERFNVSDGHGVAMEIFGQSTRGLLGYGFIYTNDETISIGTGAMLQDLIESGLNTNDILNDFKAHPSIAPFIEGGETIEYTAHLIPEGGWKSLPTMYADGVLIVGDAAGLVNPLNREGSNFAMISGKLAAQAIAEAKEAGDYSAAQLSRYRELLSDSFILKDLHKIRNLTDFAHERPHLFNDVPELLADVAREYLTVDSVPKKQKQQKMLRMILDRMPPKRAIDDAINGFRAMFT